MKNKLIEFVNSIIAGNEEEAKANFKEYSTEKTKHIVEQLNMFPDHESEPTKRYIVVPMGVGFDDLNHAINVANNNYDKRAKVMDTNTDEIVHVGKRLS